MKRPFLFFALTSLLTTALACAPGANHQASGTGAPTFHENNNPPFLRDWGQLLIRDNALQLAKTATPYDLNTPLFTDYALKLRTVWLPNGQSASYREGQVLDFPVGTVITKTFYYPIQQGQSDKTVLKQKAPVALQNHALPLHNIRLIETRILAHRTEGWVAFPYVWNAEQTEARLQRTGAIIPLSLLDLTKGQQLSTRQDFSYIVPDANQCAGCHATNNTTRKIIPIGPKPRHLNRTFSYERGSENQLIHWQQTGLLQNTRTPEAAPRNANWQDESASLNARARAWLDINCSHCHNEQGPADTSGLHLEPQTPIGPNLGLCKLPVAAGAGTGNRLFDIVPGAPEQSIFIYRMASTNPGAMMPELGRSLAHQEGVALVSAWISALDGTCQ